MATTAACGSSASGSTSRAARVTASCRSVSSAVVTRKPPRSSRSGSAAYCALSWDFTRSAYSGAVLGGSGSVSRTGRTAATRSKAAAASCSVMCPLSTIWLSVYRWRTRALSKSLTGL